MKPVQLNYRAAIELVGVIAVVASLVFVGLQLSQDRILALVDSHAAEIESRKDDRRASLESDTFMELQETLWARGERPSWWFEDLEHSNIGSLGSGSLIMAAALDEELDLLGMDAQYFRYQRGLISEQVWDGIRITLERRLQDPFRRAVALNLSVGLREVISEIVASIERDNGT